MQVTVTPGVFTVTVIGSQPTREVIADSRSVRFQPTVVSPVYRKPPRTLVVRCAVPRIPRVEGAGGVVAYDSSWPERSGRERASLEEVLAPWLRGGIHQIGSTAVPGLAARP